VAMKKFSNSEVVNTLSDKELEKRQQIATKYKNVYSNNSFIFREQFVVPLILKYYPNWSSNTIKTNLEEAERQNLYPLSENCLNGLFQQPTKEEIINKEVNIYFTELEYKCCQLLGVCRQAHNMLIRKKSDIFSHYLKGEQIHIYGILSEFAGSKYLDIHPDFTNNCRAAEIGKDNGDGKIHHLNMNVDWKKSKKGIRVNKNKLKNGNDIDLYGAIEQVNNYQYICKGFVSGKILLKEGHERSNEYYMNFTNLKAISHYF